jgi:hypothetical protein
MIILLNLTQIYVNKVLYHYVAHASNGGLYELCNVILGFYRWLNSNERTCEESMKRQNRLYATVNTCIST